ncbi:hypothetical protein A7K73_00955 [Candidatus Methylacidiphilum fumarolicum]|uniref:DUF4412 domain-containing protein n=3 Tax=Candidatus Methylacidiphilum fumarolicum TaxID=591154 RepID=I0JVC9_METFB|nr:hypothetical protein [Candidatus Methylacidiphilum fumarolicum]TFE68335.1 hypothetical protein A7K73_00955 [Candidatus Methylacidiphilum fumarolicum]TFE76522.1 hypothetical protein A7D33_09255 [Candidatus Methylacidiphilum fumarolicum]CAI9084525.1 conserved protein of unknown function [Candidatus Methylacidiphilum fumarolicum]CCG91198.1 conserved hypothetical protein [Methylacidiphilum fumariolicum SolV]
MSPQIACMLSMQLLFLLLCFKTFGGIPFKEDTQFSVLQIIHGEGYPPRKQRVFVDDKKMRLELLEGEKENIMIYRSDLGVIYSLMPNRKLCFVIPYSQELKEKDPITSNTLNNITPEGTETLNEIVCDKFDVVGSFGKAFLWISKENRSPIRLSSEDGKNVVDWINYQKGPQPPELFEPPKGYQIIDMSKNIPKKSTSSAPPNLSH